MIVVSDSSVLSCLSEIGELDLLRRLYGQVTITETIRKEAIHSSAPEALRLLLLEMPDWIWVVPDASSNLEETGALDAGKEFLKILSINMPPLSLGYLQGVT